VRALVLGTGVGFFSWVCSGFGFESVVRVKNCN
jgi:hypothetical protein